MTIRTETRFFVACDGDDCETEHHLVTDDSALGARISAGMDGWRHVSSRPGGKGGKGKRLAADLCQECSAKAEDAPHA